MVGEAGADIKEKTMNVESVSKQIILAKYFIYRFYHISQYPFPCVLKRYIFAGII